MTQPITQTVFTTADVNFALDAGDVTLAKRLLQLVKSGVAVPASEPVATSDVASTEEPRRGRVSRSGGNHPMIGQVLAWIPKAGEYVTASMVDEAFPALGGTYQVNAVLDWLEEQKVLGQGERAKGRAVLVRDAATLTALAAQSASSNIVAIPDGQGAKRSRADLLAIRMRLLDFVVHNEGKRIEEMALAFGVDSRTIVGPMRHLIEDKLVRTEGEKRGTKYFATSKGRAQVDSTAIVPAKDEETKPTPSKKRSRKPSKKASKKASGSKKSGGSKKAKSGGSKKKAKASASKPEAPKAEGKLPESTTSATV